MNTKNPVMELMVPFNLAGYKIRIWWTDDGTSFEKIRQLVELTTECWPEGIGFKECANGIAEISDQVAAVEVLNYHGQGIVYYPDWK